MLNWCERWIEFVHVHSTQQTDARLRLPYVVNWTMEMDFTYIALDEWRLCAVQFSSGSSWTSARAENANDRSHALRRHDSHTHKFSISRNAPIRHEIILFSLDSTDGEHLRGESWWKQPDVYHMDENYPFLFNFLRIRKSQGLNAIFVGVWLRSLCTVVFHFK